MTACKWTAPGANPYKGTLAQALDRYNFTAQEKADIIWRHKKLNFDTFVLIRKDYVYAPFGGDAWDLRDMHFGRGYCPGEVDRSGWSEHHEELALVYCAGTTCVAIPRVCGNVSQIQWRPYQKPEVEIRPEWEGRVPSPFRDIPEPGTLVLVLIALALVAYLKGRKL